MSRPTFHDLMRKLAIDADRFRRPGRTGVGEQSEGGEEFGGAEPPEA